MNDRRLSFLSDNDFTQSSFETLQIALAILNKNFYYLKEILPGSTVYIDVELVGNTHDFKYTSFSHSLFNYEEKLAVYSTMLLTWFDLKTRRSIIPPDDLKEIAAKPKKSDQYKLLSEEEVKNARIPARSITL